MNTELNFPPKLRGARSRLYRRRFLQVNTRWKALAEIYTMHTFAQFCNRIFLSKNCQNFRKILQNSAKCLANFEKIEIAELCKGVHCVDLGESFQTHIFLQNLASIQPRTSPVKFARPSLGGEVGSAGGGPLSSGPRLSDTRPPVAVTKSVTDGVHGCLAGCTALSAEVQGMVKSITGTQS